MPWTVTGKTSFYGEDQEIGFIQVEKEVHPNRDDKCLVNISGDWFIRSALDKLIGIYLDYCKPLNISNTIFDAIKWYCSCRPHSFGT